MFVLQFIWLLCVTLDKLQQISTISTSSLRSGWILQRAIWHQGWKTNQRAQKCYVFTQCLIYALSAVTLGLFLFSFRLSFLHASLLPSISVLFLIPCLSIFCPLLLFYPISLPGIFDCLRWYLWSHRE